MALVMFSRLVGALYLPPAQSVHSARQDDHAAVPDERPSVSMSAESGKSRPPRASSDGTQPQGRWKPPHRSGKPPISGPSGRFENGQGVVEFAAKGRATAC